MTQEREPWRVGVFRRTSVTDRKSSLFFSCRFGRTVFSDPENSGLFNSGLLKGIGGIGSCSFLATDFLVFVPLAFSVVLDQETP